MTTGATIASLSEMPNRNAYLAVCFSECTRHALVVLQDELEAHLEQDGHAFDRMSVDGLHMTFLFAGESLGRMRADELAAWHAQTRAVIKETARPSGDANMHFSGIDVFPPGKCNLLVARFEVPPWLTEQQRVIEAAAHAAGVRCSTSEAKAGYGVWAPHVTLGKVRAKRAEVTAAASRAAKSVNTMCRREAKEGCGVSGLERDVLDALLMAPADGLTLCGDLPRQKWIDWRRSLRFDGSVRNDGVIIVLDNTETE